MCQLPNATRRLGNWYMNYSSIGERQPGSCGIGSMKLLDHPVCDVNQAHLVSDQGDIMKEACLGVTTAPA